jgi:hypothetical protein
MHSKIKPGKHESFEFGSQLSSAEALGSREGLRGRPDGAQSRRDDAPNDQLDRRDRTGR